MQGVPKNQAGPPLPLPACPPWAAPCRAALVGAEGTDGCLSLLPPQCEWLLGDRKPSPEELDQGIDPDSPLFRAILDNPVVQLGLTNPKTLLAFEDMLENPLNSTQWMNDPDTGPVMLQISRLFQTLNRT